MKKKRQKKRKILKIGLLGLFALVVFACWQNMGDAGKAPAWKELLTYTENEIYEAALKNYMPAVMMGEKEEVSFSEYFEGKMMTWLPVQHYVYAMEETDTQIESELSYEILMAREGVDENYRDGELIETTESTGVEEPVETEEKMEETFVSISEPVVQISREKLNDFDYLIQNFYTVDRTTTITSRELNASELLQQDMRLTTTSEQPQILIHHTHSQEKYADSNEDASTSIVGVGAYLTKLLRERYGFNVIHDTGEYDVIDHADAYSYAGPAVEKILAENPSIEVVIDMHRDGIKEGHLVTGVNGKPTAKIMFFNGLSRTTTNGELEYLHNPYLKENLAFSLQMKLAAEEYYPGFARTNYLKGYRYNLHYCPKSMLVEVGAQTNSVQEAMNAMEPLADLLYKVLMQ